MSALKVESLVRDLEMATQEIERLRGEVERLRGLLGQISIEMNRRHSVVNKANIDAILAKATEGGGR